jgi:hypothetical protein
LVVRLLLLFFLLVRRAQKQKNLNDRPADTHTKRNRAVWVVGLENLYLDKHGIANESAINRPASFFR